MAKTTDPVLVANEAFVTEVDGERLTFSKGDPIEADHKAVKANPHLFGPLVFRHPIHERVEQATAAPGEKRSILRRKPRKATAAEETAIAATVEAEAEPEKAPEGKPMRVSDQHEKRG